MGKRGPKPTPTILLDARGSWLAKKRTGEPEAVPGMPECPAWLVGEGRIEWDRQVEDLDQRRLLAKSYRAALSMWCQSWGQYVDAVRDVQEHGHTYMTDKGNEVQRPVVGVMHRAFDQCLKLGQQFGFSPASQASIKTNDKPKEKSGKSRFFAS